MRTILAPLLAEITLNYIKEYDSIDGQDVVDLVVEFKVYNELVIKGLYDVVYKKHPYNAMSMMEQITDFERTKIKRIIYKK